MHKIFVTLGAATYRPISSAKGTFEWSENDHTAQRCGPKGGGGSRRQSAGG
jgi:hypothetical protein